MPDWTYHPLRPFAAAVLGRRRSERAALRGAAALGAPSKIVLATPGVLRAAGPGWFQRVIEAVTPTAPPVGLRDIRLDPRRWPPWWWGMVVGFGMVGAGLGAGAITLGPVLLWYDNDYLG